MFRNWTSYFICIFGAASLICCKMDGDKSANLRSGAGDGAFTIKAASAANGDMQFNINASQTVTVTTGGSTNGSDAFKQVSLTIPAGAIIGTGTFLISEGASLALPQVAEAIAVSSITQAGPTVMLSAQSATINGTLTLETPITSQLPLLDSGSKLVVLGVYSGAGGSSSLEVISGSQISLIGKSVRAQITKFGAYQPVILQGEPKSGITTVAVLPVKAPGGSTASVASTLLIAASAADLPGCNSETINKLYFTTSTQDFQTCTSTGWKTINLSASGGSSGL